MIGSAEQLSLLGPYDAPLLQPEVLRGRPGQLLGYNLFLAIFPQADDAQRFGLLGTELRSQHGLRGDCLQTQHLHVSLHAVESFGHSVPRSVIDAAMAAAAGVACAPFSIVFDRVCSFKHRTRPDNNAFVLRCDAPSGDAVARLRQALAVSLRRSGLHPKPSNTPHMTLAYDDLVIPEHPIAPLRWTATRFALILSHQGLGHHEWLGQWRLT